MAAQQERTWVEERKKERFAAVKTLAKSNSTATPAARIGKKRKERGGGAQESHRNRGGAEEEP
jgi:hypothetical protein